MVRVKANEQSLAIKTAPIKKIDYAAKFFRTIAILAIYYWGELPIAPRGSCCDDIFNFQSAGKRLNVEVWGSGS